MTESALLSAKDKISSDPAFLGKCIVNIDAALAEENLDIDEKEKELLREIINSNVCPISSKVAVNSQISFAFKEANELNIDISEYFRVRREYELDYSRKFTYDTITDAINQMKNAFNTTLWMHRVTFYTGISLIFIAVYAAFMGLDLLAGILGLGGVADISYHFYKKPVEGVYKSIGNLVQLEAAFIGFTNELGFWKSFQAGQDIEKNNKVAEAMRELTGKTLYLIERYVEKQPSKEELPVEQE